MKIDTTLIPTANAKTTPAARTDSPTPAVAAPASNANAERIDISALTVRLRETSAGEEPFDTQKVAEIKQAITEGRFRIDPERIAASLLEGVRELFSRQR